MVEKWLLRVQEVMILSLKDVMEKAVLAYTQVPRSKWVLDWPGQVVIAASSIHWTTEVAEAIDTGKLAVSNFIHSHKHMCFLLAYMYMTGLFGEEQQTD